MGEGEDVGQVVEHEEPEEAKAEPGAAEPDREEEGGQGEHVDDGVEREHLSEERLGCNQPQEEEQEENNAQGKVNLKGDVVLPTDALLHEGPGGVDDEDDHGSDVAAELEDDEHPATEGLAGYGTGGPFLNLGYKGAWQGKERCQREKTGLCGKNSQAADPPPVPAI